jgi:hypothetical protein
MGFKKGWIVVSYRCSTGADNWNISSAGLRDSKSKKCSSSLIDANMKIY